MAHFTDAQCCAGQALSWASLPELGFLPDAVVQGQMFSEAYGESLHLPQVETLGGDEPPTFHQADHPGSWAAKCWGQRGEPPRQGAEHNPTGAFLSTPTPDWWCGLGSGGGVTEAQRRWDMSQIEAGDSESTREGNSREKEWLELAGGRIAVPLWQSWDRRQRMLLPEAEARCSLSAMEEAAGPLAPAPPAAGQSGGEDFPVYDGMETIAWDADCFSDFAGARGARAGGAQGLADRSKVTADDLLCMSRCLPDAAGEEKLEMHSGESTLSLSFFFLKNSVISSYVFLRKRAVTILKMELTSLCATFSPFRFFFLSLLTDSYMVCVQLARRRGLTFGFSPSCKD